LNELLGDKDKRIPASEHRPERLYVAADGTTVHESDGWHESKVGCVYWENEGVFGGDSDMWPGLRILRGFGGICSKRPAGVV